MKSRIKKLITIALAATMLLGMTLTVNAANTRTIYVNCINKDCFYYNSMQSPFDDCYYCSHHCRSCGCKYGTTIKCPVSKP